jgi:2-methylcitrate dehydratase PrpD
VHPHHYDKGWHPTATLGIFGTVAAAAFALKLGPETTATAMAIAASMASGIKANFGTMTKPLHIGHSARSGLLAVFLAERGFDANPGAIEHNQGFLNIFNGPGLFDPTPLTDAWDSPLDIELPSLGLKQFPCCGSTHQAIFAMIGLARDADINTNDVRKIEIGTHLRRLRHTDTPVPQSALQAKFSVQYVVARALLNRSVRLKDFKEGAFAQPEIRRLLKLTTAAPLDENGPGLKGLWDAEVAITLADGRRHVRQVEGMVGRSGDNAMSVDELRNKFMDCATLSIAGHRAARAFGVLMDLENQASMAKVVAMLAGGGKCRCRGSS